MREAIGGTWLFNIVVLFVMLFTGYLCLAINYSRAYNVKNEIVDIIERENGYTDKAAEDIAAYLTNVGYRTTGKCSEGMTGNNSDKDFGVGENVYCYKVVNVGGEEDYAESSYYQVEVFFQIDLPIFRDWFTFSIKGDSNQLFYSDV